MKKLQNNFTTPEQSKQLLELGVPADSADCYVATNNGRAIVLNLLFSEFIENIVAGGFNNPDAFLPCWSVGRLMEIIAECYQVDMPFRYFVRGGMMESLINTYEDLQHEIDFSKLED